MAVSQQVTGDGEKQRTLVAVFGGGMDHLQLNPRNANIPARETPHLAARAASIGFFAYGVLPPRLPLKRYQAGRESCPSSICENGIHFDQSARSRVRAWES